MRRHLPAVAMFLFATALAGCGQNMTPEEQAMQDERDIAMVERANASAPPVREVLPEPIGYPELERYDLMGTACNYAPGTSFGTRVIAREADAYVKINGEMVRLAADPGSRALPAGSRSLYSGKTYSLQLGIAGEGKPAGTSADYEGTVTLRDSWGREVYEGTGLARCGG